MAYKSLSRAFFYVEDSVAMLSQIPEREKKSKTNGVLGLILRRRKNDLILEDFFSFTS